MSDDDDSAGLDAVPRRGGGGRRHGVPNYNNRILIPIIEEILPNGTEAWRLVAAAYKEQSGEDNLRSEDDLKRNWVRKLCNNMKKPTGGSGADSTKDRTNRCIEIQRKILDKTASGILGASSDDDNRFAPSSPSLSLSSSSDEEVVPGTELQVPPRPANDDVESTDGNEATGNVEATDVAASANLVALLQSVGEASALDVEVELANSTHSLPTSTTRRLSPRPSSSMSTTAPRPPPQKPRKNETSRTSKTNKTKNSTNRERGSVTKSIERIASSIASGSGEDMRMMLEMRKMEWEEAEERRREEREEARREREEMRQERMEMEDRRDRRFERQMQQQSEMMQMMMMVMMGGARESKKKSGGKEDNSDNEGE
jgi:hypothetical protein